MAGRRSKRYRLVHVVPVGVQGQGVRFSGDIVDISTNGILIRCPDEIPKGTVVRLGIGFAHRTARIVAVARRNVPAVGVAFEFRNMGQSDRELVHRLLVQLQANAIPARP